MFVELTESEINLISVKLDIAVGNGTLQLAHLSEHEQTDALLKAARREVEDFIASEARHGGFRPPKLSRPKTNAEAVEYKVNSRVVSRFRDYVYYASNIVVGTVRITMKRKATTEVSRSSHMCSETGVAMVRHCYLVGPPATGQRSQLIAGRVTAPFPRDLPPVDPVVVIAGGASGTEYLIFLDGID